MQRVYVCRLCHKKTIEPGDPCRECKAWLIGYHAMRRKQTANDCRTKPPDYEERMRRLTERARNQQPLFAPNTET